MMFVNNVVKIDELVRHFNNVENLIMFRISKMNDVAKVMI